LKPRPLHPWLRRTAPLWLVLIMTLMLGGCGYSQQRLFPQGIQTVSVRIFKNRTFYQGVQFDLTEALVKQIELQTPYKAVKGSGDTVLEGTITAIGQKPLSRTSQGGLVQELEFRIVVDFQWKDVRSGQVLRQRRGLTAVGRYVPTSPVGEPFQVGQHAAVQRLADQIVSAMRSGL
jgi:hypothetical protein